MCTPLFQSMSGRIGSSSRSGVQPCSGSAKPYRPVHQLRRVGRVVRFSGKCWSKTTPSAARRSRCGRLDPGVAVGAEKAQVQAVADDHDDIHGPDSSGEQTRRQQGLHDGGDPRTEFSGPPLRPELHPAIVQYGGLRECLRARKYPLVFIAAHWQCIDSVRESLCEHSVRPEEICPPNPEECSRCDVVDSP